MNRLLALATCCVCACFSPHPQPGSPCSDEVCPEGLVCSPATQTCELRASESLDAAVDTVGVQDNAVLVQQQVGQLASAASLSVTLPHTPTPGHMLVMIGGAWAHPIDTVRGGGVATWTLAARSLDNTNIELWYGVSDGSSPKVTIDTSASGKMSIAVTEWSGLATTNVLDGTRSGSGWSSSVAVGSIVSTNARDLLLFGLSDYSSNSFGSPAPGTWTALAGSTAVYPQLTWMSTTTVASTYDPQVIGDGQGWDAVLVALRIAP